HDLPRPRRDRARARPDARTPRRRGARHLAQGSRRRAGQLRPRPRPASGGRAAPRRNDGAARRRPQRLADHGDPNRRRFGGRDEAARPATLTTGRDPRLRGAGPIACGRDARGLAGGGAARVEPGPGARRGARARGARARVRLRRGGAPRRRRGLHVYRVTGADRRARRRRSWCPRQCGRLVRHVGPRARGGHRRRRLALRRPPRVDGERIRRLPRSRRRARHRPRAHPRGARRAARLRAHGAALRRGADRVQVARARRGGPRRRGAVRRGRPRARPRGRGGVLIPLDAIETARRVTAGTVLTTPLVRLEVDAPCEIWLKLECLQPIGSFKLRGATSAIRQSGPDAWRDGVWTTSAGNMAQGVCWVARELGVPATVVAPDHAPRAKLDAVERLGGRTITVPWDTWWETMENGAYPGLAGFFVHPVLDEHVMAGNGVIGLELAEQLDGIDAVLMAWGGGGLTTGVASALAAVSPATRVIACEPETGAPLTASLAAGAPVEVDYRPSFVDGAGSKALLAPMWDRAQRLVSAATAVTLRGGGEGVGPLPATGRARGE